MSVMWTADDGDRARLDGAVAAIIAAAGTLSDVPAGTQVYSPTSPPRAFLVVATGTVRVQVGSAGGREAVLYRVGDQQICPLSTAFLLSGQGHAATAVAETAVRAWQIEAAAFRRLFDESPPFREWVLRAQGARLAELIAVVEASVLDPVETRLARYLLGRPIARITHATLAREIATSREVVSRILGRFARHGWISQRRGEIQVEDPSALRRRIGAQVTDGRQPQRPR